MKMVSESTGEKIMGRREMSRVTGGCLNLIMAMENPGYDIDFKSVDLHYTPEKYEGSVRFGVKGDYGFQFDIPPVKFEGVQIYVEFLF